MLIINDRNHLANEGRSTRSQKGRRIQIVSPPAKKTSYSSQGAAENGGEYISYDEYVAADSRDFKMHI